MPFPFKFGAAKKAKAEAEKTAIIEKKRKEYDEICEAIKMAIRLIGDMEVLFLARLSKYVSFLGNIKYAQFEKYGQFPMNINFPEYCKINELCLNAAELYESFDGYNNDPCVNCNNKELLLGFGLNGAVKTIENAIKVKKQNNSDKLSAADTHNFLFGDSEPIFEKNLFEELQSWSLSSKNTSYNKEIEKRINDIIESLNNFQNALLYHIRRLRQRIEGEKDFFESGKDDYNSFNLSEALTFGHLSEMISYIVKAFSLSLLTSENEIDVEKINRMTDELTFEYQYDDELNCYAIIYGLFSNETTIIFPSELGGHKIEMIGELFFGDKCKSIIISPGIKYLGGYAFRGFEQLEDVTLPDGLLEIRWRAFEDCYSLTHIVIPDSVTFVEVGAFRNCINLQDCVYKGISYSFENIKSLYSLFPQDDWDEREDYEKIEDDEQDM